MQWHKSSNVLLAGVTSGNLYMYNIPNGDVRIFAQGYGDPLETFVILPDGKKRMCMDSIKTTKYSN